MSFFLAFFFKLIHVLMFLEQSLGSDCGVLGRQKLLVRNFKIARIVSVFASRRLRYFYFFREKFHKERYKAH